MSTSPALADAALQLTDVAKSYPAWAGRGLSLHDLALRRVPLGHRRGPRKWAVDGLSLSVRPGESVGLIGGNGAGKSTLLRIAAGVTTPTRGAVVRPSDTAAVLTLGEAFSLDLNGEENALTTAIVSGFTPRRARELVPEILAYAELEDAAHAPVRTYSEGMKLRLAFAVVAQLTPRALVLDEVMAVGDLAFQRKSRAFVSRARDEGAAVLFATHDLGRLLSDADRVLWLDQGRVRMAGEPHEVVTAYERQMDEETARRTPARVEGGERTRLGSGEVTMDRIVLRSGVSKDDIPTLMPGGELSISWTLTAHTAIATPPIVAVTIRDEAGERICSLTTERDSTTLPVHLDEHRMTLSLDRLDLVPGRYFAELGVFEGNWKYAFDLHADGEPFEVLGHCVPHGFLNPPRLWTTT